MMSFLTFNTYLRQKFGCRVQKIPIDAGLTCPNRDGRIGRGGCIYCNQLGSGTGAFSKGVSIREQMERGIMWARRRYKARKFIAYFQSYSNTYAPLHVLEDIYSQALLGPDVVGLFISTRPDCIDDERLELIKRVSKGRMLWMEYGLQSASDKTLSLINRGHKVADFIRAVEITHEFGIPVCAHVIFGLPGEGQDEMTDTVRLLSDLGIEGVKFHQLYVVKGTVLHDLYKKGRYQPISREEYVDMVLWAIRHLSKETVIHRLTGDPMPGELVAPDWSLEKTRIIQQIRSRIGTN